MDIGAQGKVLVVIAAQQAAKGIGRIRLTRVLLQGDVSFVTASPGELKITSSSDIARLTCSNAAPRAVRPIAEVRKRVSTDVVLAQ